MIVFRSSIVTGRLMVLLTFWPIRVREKQEIFFTEASSLFRQVKVAMKNDQANIPNFRIRISKDNVTSDMYHIIVIIFCYDTHWSQTFF